MSENNFMTSDLGAVTAYAAAAEKGYTGTQDEFGQLLANFAGSAQQVAEDRTAVEDAKKAVDQQVSNFDTHVEEKKAEASESISSAANTAKEEGIAAIQETSTSGVKSVQDKTAEGIKALETSSQIGVSNINSAVEEGKKNFVTDDTLTISGRAADAKATGDKIGKLKEDLGDIGAEFIRYNLFDKSKATVVSIMCNSSLVFITGNGVQSTIFKCDPDTVYSVSWNAATGNSRFVVYTSENMPVIDGVSKANRRIALANTLSGSTRHYETITTSENERYLLLYFGSNATGDENVLNSIQISKGANLLEYTSHKNYEMPNFQLSQSQKDEILNSVPDYTNTLADKVDIDGVNEVSAINASFIETINILDSEKVTHCSYMKNAKSGKVFDGNVQSLIVKIKPNSKYNFSAIGINAQHIYTTKNYPYIGEEVLRDIVFTDSKIGERYFTDIETTENENYLLIYFYNNSTTDTITVQKTMQLSIGLGLKEYSDPKTGELNINISIPVSLNEMFANLLSYRQLGQLSKGYLCISFDDGYSTAESTTFPIIEEAQVPVTFCCWTESEIITNTTYLNELKTLISDYGCEVAQHGVGDFTTYSDKDLYKYLLSEKEKFSDLGILVNGMSYPNHKRNNNVRAICGGLYNVCQSGGTKYPIVYENNSGGERSNIFDLYRNSGYSRTLSQLEKGIDDALNNHRIYNVFWHDTDLENNADQVQKLKAMITYAKEKGITFITIGNIANAI